MAVYNLRRRRSSDELLQKVRIGLHCGVVAEFARTDDPWTVRLVRPAPIIDQVFTAALNKRARGVSSQDPAVVSSKMRFLLAGAYRGTYAAAAMRKSQLLVLTLVGGGVFDNPIPVIASELAGERLHRQWRSVGTQREAPGARAGVAAAPAIL